MVFMFSRALSCTSVYFHSFMVLSKSRRGAGVSDSLGVNLAICLAIPKNR